MKIAGELSNAFADISGYEYIGHEIVYETPDESSRPLIGIKIYVYSGEQPLGVPLVVFGIVLALSVIFAYGTPVAESWGTIVGEAAMYRKTIRELERVSGERDDALLRLVESDLYAEIITPEEAIDRVKAIVANDRALWQEFLGKNDPESYDRYVTCVDDAEKQYLIDGDFNKYLNTVSSCLDTRLSERKTETEENYSDDDFVDLDFTDAFDKMLTYMIYGGAVVGALLLSQIAITTTSTFRR
jgi:hypothetical protein